jgi:DNA-binding CsgD family transcriptional regulator/tetratricopeptide (TPR) repeat protein
MTNQAIRRELAPRKALKVAEGLYAQAEYRRVITTLDALGHDDEQVTVLRAKTLSRLGQPRDVLALIERFCAQHGDVPLLCAIATTAAAQCENEDIVASWARRAGNPRSIARRRADAAWYLANGFWVCGRYDLAKSLLPIAFTDGSANGALRARLLYGLLLATQERYAQQARVLQFAVTHAAGDEVEVGLFAIALHSLCGLASEMPSVAEPHELRRLYDTVQWSSCLSASHFNATQALGWRYALSGDYATAYQMLWRARSIAPTPAFELFAQVDLAMFAREAGESHHAESCRRYAQELARKLDVSSVVGDERYVFIGLAELLADSDPQSAQRWLAEYDASRARAGRLNALSHDRRLDATADHARGLVLFHAGRRADGVRALEAARAVFSEIGYEWRAARSTRALYEITRETRWLPHAKGTPHAAHSREKLTRRESEIKDLIVRGMTIQQIAGLLVLSVRTVENHTQRVLKKLGLHSQRELILSAHKKT